MREVSGVLELVDYSVMGLPISKVRDPRFSTTGPYSDDIRMARDELLALSSARPNVVSGDNLVFIIYLRLPRGVAEEETVANAHNGLCLIDKRVVTETAHVSASEIGEAMLPIPDDTDWVTVVDWRNATLLLLHFSTVQSSARHRR